MNEPMSRASQDPATEHTYVVDTQHPASSEYEHQMSDNHVQTQPAVFGEYDMHTWNPHMSVSTDYTVAPGSNGFSEYPMASPPSQCVWPSSLDNLGETTDRSRLNEANLETSVMGATAADSYQLYGYYPGHQFYPYHALDEMPATAGTTWIDHNQAIDAQQPWNPTPLMENYQQSPTHGAEPVRAPSPSIPGGRRSKTHADANVEPQPRAPKKRGRPRKVKNADLPPVVVPPIIAAHQELQPPPSSSTSLNPAWTSELSPTFCLSPADGSTSSSHSDLMSCDVKAEQHSLSDGNYLETHHVPPRVIGATGTLHSGNSFPSSPSETAVPVMATSYQQQQQQQHPPAYPAASHQAPLCPTTSAIPGGASSQQSPQQSMPLVPTGTDCHQSHPPLPTKQPPMASLPTGHDLHALSRRALPERDQKSRNRVAATKCRLKTKAATTALEEEEKVESERNFVLSDMAARLREEYFMLRNQLLMHTNCKCTLIHQYLEKQARQLAETGNCFTSVNQGTKGSSPGNSIAVEEEDDEAGGSEDAEGEEWDAQTMVETKKGDEPAAEADEKGSQVRKRRRVGRPRKGSGSASTSPPVASAPPGSPRAATATGNLVQVREKVVRRRLTKGSSLVTGMVPGSGQLVAGLVQ